MDIKPYQVLQAAAVILNRIAALLAAGMPYDKINIWLAEQEYKYFIK